MKQKYGAEAKMMLKSMIENKSVEVKCYDKSYDREVCKVFIDRKDIAGKELFKLNYISFFFCLLSFFFLFLFLFYFYFFFKKKNWFWLV
jgi:hypothetical protein